MATKALGLTLYRKLYRAARLIVWLGLAYDIINELIDDLVYSSYLKTKKNTDCIGHCESIVSLLVPLVPSLRGLYPFHKSHFPLSSRAFHLGIGKFTGAYPAND